MTTPFGTLPDGRAATLYTLQNAAGFRADICDYGANVVRLFAPDRLGRLGDVVLGFDDVAAYVAQQSYIGGTIGRCGNRIRDGRFTLDGRVYELACNSRANGIPCHLHGGERGFDRVLWSAEPFASADGPSLRLRYRSADGEAGYPGNLDATVTYTVTAANTLRIAYTASTDRPTPVALTNHAYFNLAGEGSGPVLDHILTVHAPDYTPVDQGMIPTGSIAPVTGTPFDFLVPQPIGARIDARHEQLRIAGGYDHNFVLARGGSTRLAPAATVLEPTSGRQLDVWTTEPGIQFYSGNFLDGSLVGKSGRPYALRHGFCLETQGFPDAPNQPSFPSVILRPGATLHSTTEYRFRVR